MDIPHRIIFADELTMGNVILDACTGVIGCASATTHEPGVRIHERTVLRARTRDGLTSAIVLDEDGNQQPYQTNSINPVAIRS